MLLQLMGLRYWECQRRLGIIAAVLAVKVVREIQYQQVESAKAIQPQSTFAQPPARRSSINTKSYAPQTYNS